MYTRQLSNVLSCLLLLIVSDCKPEAIYTKQLSNVLSCLHLHLSVWFANQNLNTQGSYQMACLSLLLHLWCLICKPEPINTRQLSNGLSYLLLHLGVWFANQNLHTQGNSSNGLSCLLLLIGSDCKPEPIYTRQLWNGLSCLFLHLSVWLQTRSYIHKEVFKWPVLPPFAFRCLIANQNLYTQGSYQMSCLPFFCI